MKKLNLHSSRRSVAELRAALEKSARKSNREIARLKQRLHDQRAVAKEHRAERHNLLICKMALAAVVSNYFAAKMGNQRCQGQLDETLKMAADVLVITDPSIKAVETFHGSSLRESRRRLAGGKPS